jgi:acyl-CoA thioester hydrolase
MVFAKAVGLDRPEAVVGKTDFDLPWPSQEAEAYRADDREVMETKRAKRHIIEPLQQADGSRLWIDTTKVPLLDADGNVEGVLGVYDDITERKRTQDALREREEQLQLKLDSIFHPESDIDEQGHVNNVVYLRWAQDAAIAHWLVLAPVELQTNVGWVALRHEIDYKAPGFLNDDLRVRTWVGTVKGLSFERHTQIVRARDEQLLAQARTLWCPIDPATGRPKRVSAELRALFSTAASFR